MPITLPSNHSGQPSSFVSDFYDPALRLLASARNQRVCNELPDDVWLRLGIRRVLNHVESGRAFLQSLVSSGADAPQLSLFFETLKSQRRLALVAEVSNALARSLPPLDEGFDTAFPELAGFDVYAGDGHFHGAAAHDPRGGSSGVAFPVGHLFCLDLRSHALSHLTVSDQAERLQEHDMRGLKRMEISKLRHFAPKGRKVLYVWDRAGNDFRQWHDWKHRSGLYFISREKTNMRLTLIKPLVWDAADARNQGVLNDELMQTNQGVTVRRVRYHCPLRDEAFHFLTSEYTMPPGAVAHLYRKRWDIEKTFDELKNKLNETKAWASSATAKTMQAEFLCLTHNLMILCESALERDHGVSNQAEDKRREARLGNEEERIAKKQGVIPSLIRALQRATVRSVKFIRWLRVQLFQTPHHPPNIAALRQLYAHL